MDIKHGHGQKFEDSSTVLKFICHRSLCIIYIVEYNFNQERHLYKVKKMFVTADDVIIEPRHKVFGTLREIFFDWRVSPPPWSPYTGGWWLFWDWEADEMKVVNVQRMGSDGEVEGACDDGKLWVSMYDRMNKTKSQSMQ